MSGRKPSSQLRENIRSFLVLKGIEEKKIVELLDDIPKRWEKFDDIALIPMINKNDVTALDKAKKINLELTKNSIDSIKDSGKVKISIIEENEYLKIYISDNGIGIKQSLKNKIFNPGVTTKERGWGLGLSLSKRIIEEYHKGEIKLIESIVGQGTKMLIKLKAVK